MNYKSFNATMGTHAGYWDLYEFKVEEYFMEDTFPEVYQVISIGQEEVQPGQIEMVVRTWNITDNVPCDWFYSKEYWSPALVKLTPKPEYCHCNIYESVNCKCKPVD